VGYGDAVTPGVEEVEYPTLLDDVPAPRIHAIPAPACSPEKLEAIASLGLANSRMKDYSTCAPFAGGALDNAVLGDAMPRPLRDADAATRGAAGRATGDLHRTRPGARNGRRSSAKNGLAGPSLARVVTESVSFVMERCATHVPGENADDVHR